MMQSTPTLNPVAYTRLSARTLLCVAISWVGLTGPTQARADCENWNTEKFFEFATLTDVRRCLDAGALLNGRNKGGITPLHQAATAGTGEIVTALIRAGADIEALDKDGASALNKLRQLGLVE